MSINKRLEHAERTLGPNVGNWCQCSPVLIYAQGEQEQAAANAQAAVCPGCGLRRRPGGAMVFMPDNGRAEGMSDTQLAAIAGVNLFTVTQAELEAIAESGRGEQ